MERVTIEVTVSTDVREWLENVAHRENLNLEALVERILTVYRAGKRGRELDIPVLSADLIKQLDSSEEPLICAPWSWHPDGSRRA